MANLGTALQAPTRAVLRYHGGKWRMADWLVSLFPSHHAYVEPFGGGASVLLRKPPSKIEVYNDLDEHLVSLFRVLRDPGQAEQLRRAIELTPWSRAEFNAAWAPDVDDPVENARRMLVRSHQGVGAKRKRSRNGWRSRLMGGAPAASWARWPDQVPAFVERLRQVALECLPWQRVIEIYDAPSTLFFLDPPYMLETRAWGHRAIYDFEMSVDDHRELLARARAAKGLVFLSGYRSELYDVELADWLRLERRARAQGNLPRIEVVWINPAAAAAMPQKLLALEALG